MIDPHDDSFIARNLRKEEWVEYQRDEAANSLSEAIREAFSNGMVAKLTFTRLFDLGLDMACSAGTSSVLIQCCNHVHWAAMALCMMSHGKFQIFEVEQVVRFYLSECYDEPMYYDNIEYVKKDGIPWLVPERRKRATQDSRAPRLRQDGKTIGVSGKRDRERDETQQSCFPYVYESS